MKRIFKIKFPFFLLIGMVFLLTSCMDSKAAEIITESKNLNNTTELKRSEAIIGSI